MLVVKYKDGTTYYYAHRASRDAISKDYRFNGDPQPVLIYRPGLYKVFGLYRDAGHIRSHLVTVSVTRDGYAATGDLDKFEISVQN